jgi:ribonucleoside-diphosphate reductase alpha subunit
MESPRDAAPTPRSSRADPPVEFEVEQYVVNRHGEHVPVRFDAITDRNAALCERTETRPALAYAATRLSTLTQHLTSLFANGMSTSELDHLAAKLCADHASQHPDWGKLAARILVSDLHKCVPASMAAALKAAAARPVCRFNDELFGIVIRAADRIDAKLVHERDYDFGHFQFDAMLRSYIQKVPNTDGAHAGEQEPAERPQHMYMRVALALHVGTPDGKGHELEQTEFDARLARAFEVYELLSTQRLSHASPTMFNAGTKTQQLASCFLLEVQDDLEDIYETVKRTALISQRGGGIGVCLSRMRAEGALIKTTGGYSSGIQNSLPVLEKTQIYINQGGMRPGAFAAYLDVWHADVLTFLETGRFKGEGVRAPKLKYALTVCDPFMETLVAELRAREDIANGNLDPDSEAARMAGDWPLFSPDQCPELPGLFGPALRDALALRYAEGKATRIVKASQVMETWFKTVAQRGSPYILNGDAANCFSNLSHFQKCASSNLCAEVYLPPNSVCNLAAVPVSRFVPCRFNGTQTGVNATVGDIDWAGIIDAADTAVENLERVIDNTVYPIEATRVNNMRDRPVAVGTMGLADLFHILGLQYGSTEARAVDRAVHAAVYFGAMRASARLGRERGSFETYPGSYTSRGQLQPDLWVAESALEADWEAQVEATTSGAVTPAMWADLRRQVAVGVRHAEVTAGMPTATSSNVVGVNECFEPYTTNMYTRKTVAGTHVITNPHLVDVLEARGLWNEATQKALVKCGGSVASRDFLPGKLSPELRARFRTARELSVRTYVRHAAERAPFQSMSQSLNFYANEPRFSDALTYIVEGWKRRLKTLQYYLHTAPAAGGQKTAVAGSLSVSLPPEDLAPRPAAGKSVVCTDEVCTSCSV